MADECADQAKSVADALKQYNQDKKIADKAAARYDKATRQMNKDCATSNFKGKKGKSLEKAVGACRGSAFGAGEAASDWFDAQRQADSSQATLNDAEKSYSECEHNKEEPD